MRKSALSPTAKALFRSLYDRNRLRGAVAYVLLLLIIPFNLALSWLLGEVLDVISTGDLGRLWWLMKFTVLSTAAGALVRAAMYWVKSSYIHHGIRQYKSEAFRRLSEKSISAFRREHTGRYLSVLTNDVASIEENYINKTLLILFEIPRAITALIMILYYSWKLGLITLAFSVLPIAISVFMGRGLTSREKAVSDQNEHFVSSVKDLLSGFSVIKSFKAESRAVSRFNGENRRTETVKFSRRWWDSLSSILGWDVGGTILQGGVFLIGALMAIRGEITAGTVVIVLNVCNSVINPIQVLPQYWANRRAAKGLVLKMADLLDENVERSGEPVEPVLNEAIELQNVSYGYTDDAPVLKNINLRLEKGKKYAIVGSSGSGKTTLLNLLMGAYDSYEGSIMLDGRELRGIAVDSLYDVMSLIDQNVFLFDDTISNNVTMFREFPEEVVRQAAARAGLLPLMLERGWDYQCGENGSGLSGGERQRVSIARCLLRGTPVLLLDEATAALDARTAHEVSEAILQLEGLTRVVVTHRLDPGLMAQYDELIVLRSGEICERGSFDELMGRKGYFYSLYNVSAAA